MIVTFPSRCVCLQPASEADTHVADGLLDHVAQLTQPTTSL
jgi:hypothetical protein